MSAMPMPPIIPPMHWLRVVFGLMAHFKRLAGN
jgi:hypothetical protein